jgi:hypothetical protein
MNNLQYYNRQKDAWTEAEIQEVKTKYEINEMTISQIADSHFRTPGSIAYKLKTINVIPDNTQARGYVEYKNSSLYKEIIELSDTSKKEKKVKEDTKLKSDINARSIDILLREVIDLRHEVIDLKNEIKKMVRNTTNRGYSL